MKSRLVWQFVSLSVVNVWVCISVIAGARIVAAHWSAALEGQALPVLTTFVLQTAMIWPLTCLVLSILGIALAVRLWPNTEVLSLAFVVIVLVELCLAGLFTWAAMLPILKITYGIGG